MKRAWKEKRELVMESRKLGSSYPLSVLARPRVNLGTTLPLCVSASVADISICCRFFEVSISNLAFLFS